MRKVIKIFVVISMALALSLAMASCVVEPLHKVTFDYGDGRVDIYSVADGERVPNIGEPYSEGRSFMGWYRNGTLWNKYYGVYSDMTLVAVWTETFEYFVKEGNVIITGYAGNESDIVIPDHIDGCQVTKIEASAFKNNTSIRSVTLPTSLTVIGESAFYGCSELCEVIGAQGVLSVSDSAFEGCSKLESIEIENVSSVGNYAFADCISLATVSVGYDLSSIGEYAFANCVSLKEMFLPSATVTISSTSFEKCSSSLFSVFDNAYYLKSYNNDFAVLYKLNGNVSSCSINPDTSVIAPGAFEDCFNLLEVYIPSSVYYIGAGAFFGCTSLDTAVFENPYGWVAYYMYGSNNVVLSWTAMADSGEAAKKLLSIYDIKSGWYMSCN